MLTYNKLQGGLSGAEKLKTLGIVRYRITALFLCVFAIPYKEWEPFGTPYLNFTFICFFLYLFFCIATFRFSFRVRYISKYVIPFTLILMVFWLMTTVNYYPKSQMAYSEARRFIMCFLFYIFLINEVNARPELANACLRVFLYSLMFMTIMYFLGIGVKTGSLGRTSFAGINANRLGLWYVMGLFIVIKLFTETKVSVFEKYVMIIFSLLFLYIIARTASRSGFGALIMGPTVYLYYLKMPMKRKIPVAFAGVIFITAIGVYVGTSDLMQSRLAEVSEGSIGEREEIWATTMGLVKNNLIIGSGASGYEKYISQFFSGYEAPHNVYLLVLAYGGLISLFFFFIFLGRWGIAAYNNIHNYNSPFDFAIWSVFLVYLFTAGGTLESFHFWFVIALAAGLNSRMEGIRSRQLLTR